MPAYSSVKIRNLLRAIDVADIADERGDRLEDLSKYLLEKFPGIECVARDRVDAQRAHELDLTFWNDQRFSPLHFLDSVLFVECKASAAPVGSQDVNWFVTKLRARGSHHGILVALNGITGAAAGNASAHSEILSALHDSIRVLLLTRSELEGLSNTEQLSELLKMKLLRLTLERAVACGEDESGSN